MNKALRIAGIAACAWSLLVMSGGHLFALQSVAWMRMAIEFSKTNSIQGALAKTFSGKYPCPLCLKVQKSWQEKQKQDRELPSVATDSTLEAVWNFSVVTVPQALAQLAPGGVFGADFFYDLSAPPPKPPPRA